MQAFRLGRAFKELDVEYILGFPAEMLDEWEAYLALERDALDAEQARARADADRVR